MKIPYPSIAVRAVYTTGVDVYFGVVDPFNPDISTIERQIQFRQGDVPSVTCSATVYGVASVDLV
jgi:hypothetical protein